MFYTHILSVTATIISCGNSNYTIRFFLSRQLCFVLPPSAKIIYLLGELRVFFFLYNKTSTAHHADNLNINIPISVSMWYKLLSTHLVHKKNIMW